MLLILGVSSAFAGNGTAVWRASGLNQPISAGWDGSGFTAKDSTQAVGEWKIMAGAEAPARDEIILVGVTTGNDVTGLMRSESTWSALPFNPMSSVTQTYWWGFDVAYESQSGDAMLVYNNGTTGNTGISYRIWDGSAWSADTTFVLPVSGEVRQIRIASSPLADEIVLIASNSSSQDFVAVWNGDAWGDTLTVDAGSGDDRSDIYVAYESLTGHALVIYGQGAVTPYRRKWSGTWSPQAPISAPGSASGNVRWGTLASDPNSDNIAMGVLTYNQEVWGAVWNGAAFTSTELFANTTPGTTFPCVAVAFEGLSGEAMIVYSEASGSKLRTWDGTWSSDTDAINDGWAINTIMAETAPGTDEIMWAIQDHNSDLHMMRWDGSAMDPAITVETNTGDTKNQPFLFLWDIESSSNQPPVLAAIGAQATNENANLSFAVSASDVESTPSLTTSTLPTGATFTDNGDGTGDFDWTPTFLQSGVFNVWFYATDDSAAVDSEQVAITVNEAGNQPPILAAIGAKVTNETVNLAFTVNATDAESTPTLSTSSLPTGATFVDNGDGSGDFDWTPTITQAGVYNVTFYATDDSVVADSEIVTITVNENGNLPPNLAAIGAKSVNETVNLAFGISATDAESTPTLTTSTLPTGATFTDNGDGTGDFDWTPTIVQAGIYNVTFYATDDSAAVDSELVAITVNEVGNQPPVQALIGAKSGIEYGNFNWTVTATDAESTPTLTSSTLPTGASYVDNGDGTADFDWTPVYPQNGLHNITFYATDDSAAVDSEVVVITVDVAPTDRIAASPDSITVAMGSTTPFAAVGYTTDDSAAAPGTITWSLTSPIGSITSLGANTASFEATTAGTAKVIALSSLGVVDTTTFLEVTPGALAVLTISPDSVLISTDSTVLFSATGEDTGGTEVDPGVLTWEVLGGIGSIDSTGLFTPSTEGSGRIVATSSVGRITDTNRTVIVEAGAAASFTISPDTAIVGLNDTIQFAVVATDAADVDIAVSDVVWTALGWVGDVDSTGKFVPKSPGFGRMIASSEMLGLADTSDAIFVEALDVSAISLGTSYARPDQTQVPLLAFRIKNYFVESKEISGITVRTAFTGAGTDAQMRGNVDSLGLYRDTDGDSLLTALDDLVGMHPLIGNTVSYNFAPITLASEAGQTFLLGARVSDSPRDGDSLDLFFNPNTDIIRTDDTLISGPDSLNSLGVAIIDGMIAGQVSLHAGEADTLRPGDSLYLVAAIDIPRNGYDSDILEAIALRNFGTADANDLDSLSLFRDNGNLAWDGTATETFAGSLVYTGGLWMLTGLSQSLPDTSTRFFVTAAPTDYPGNGTTLSLGLPVSGLSFASGNDGPIDLPLPPVDTAVIAVEEQVSVTASVMPGGRVSPDNSIIPITSFTVTNTAASIRTVDSIIVTSFAADPRGASQSDLDSQFEAVYLYDDLDGRPTTLGASDTVIASGTFSNGRFKAAKSGLSLPALGESRSFTLAAKLDSRRVRDGNSINLGLSGPNAIYLAGGHSVTGSSPIKGSDLVVDRFAAGEISVTAQSVVSHFGGQTDQVVFQFKLPANGYASDVLSRLVFDWTGTLQPTGAVDALKLWSDATGDGLTDDDVLLGSLSRSGRQYVLNSISQTVAGSGQMFLVTIDISTTNFEGGTLLLSIPTGGILYESGMSGPDDTEISMSEQHLIVSSDRVTAISLPVPSSVVAPGSSNNQIMTFALYNGYVDSDKTLSSIRFTNVSRSPLDVSFTNDELGQVALYLDADGSRDWSGDPLVATGRFADQHLRFDGLDITLPAESLSYFFVLADLPMNVADGDSLEIEISEASDLVFSGSVSLNGNMPISGGNHIEIDGSVVGQYEVIDVASRSLSPGDTSVPIMAFRPATNGYLEDTLQTVIMENSLSADTSDLETLELWRDANDDDVWQSSDQYLGAFSYASSSWSVGGLDLPLGAVAPTLFVTCDVSSTASPSATVRARIPEMGCLYSSANDGPRDGELIGTGTFTVSTSGLRLALEPLSPTYSVGQSISVAATVYNISGTPLDSVLAEVVTVSNDTIVSVQSLPSSWLTIPANDSTLFEFDYLAVSTGSLYWSLRAVSKVDSDTSAVMSTPTVDIQDIPSPVEVTLLNSIPTAVSRGQANVFPLSISVQNTDTSISAAAVKIDSLTLSVKDASGSPQSADDIFSRVVLSTQYANLVVLESLPDQSDVALPLPEPVEISPGTQRILSLLVDIDSLASANEFLLSLEASTSLAVSDVNTDDIVTVNSSQGFPISTASCRIEDPSSHVALSAQESTDRDINKGQENVPILSLGVRHPGGSSESQIQVSEIGLSLVGSLGDTVEAETVISHLRVQTEQLVLGEISGTKLDTTHPVVTLSSPITLSPGDDIEIQITASIVTGTSATEFRAVIPDSSHFLARELSSGSSVWVTTDTAALATGSVFPVESGEFTLRLAAVPPKICVESVSPPSLVAGVDAAALVSASISYEAAANSSPVTVEALGVRFVDSLGIGLDPNLLFDRIGYALDGGSPTYQSFIELSSGQTIFRLGDDGLTLDRGEQANLILVADLEAQPVYDLFVIEIAQLSNLSVHDATDTSQTLAAEAIDTCSATIPLVSGQTIIVLPAGRPTLEPENLPTQIAYAGASDVLWTALQFDYSSQEALGDILFEGLSARIQRRTADGLGSATGVLPFEYVSLYLDNDLIAIDSTYEGGLLNWVPSEELVITSGFEGLLLVKAGISGDAAEGNFAIQFEDSTFMQLSDLELGGTIVPMLVSASYPWSSSDISISKASLGESFTNYPNPFRPNSGEKTTIGYVLPEDAHVTIELYTITGELVKTVVDNAFRSAGAHQDDRWNGVNGVGLDVITGTYFCRISAKYSSGREESFKRKIAVVR